MKVLFLCTGNSCRSILAEATLNAIGRGRFQAFSAGSQPTGEVHPQATRLLEHLGYDTSHLRSKKWDEFATADAPAMDIVITVCDRAAGEACPVWPGHPVTAHWSFPDPAAFEGTEAERRAFFEQVYRQIAHVLDALVKLPVETMEASRLRRALDALAELHPMPSSATRPPV